MKTGSALAACLLWGMMVPTASAQILAQPRDGAALAAITSSATRNNVAVTGATERSNTVGNSFDHAAGITIAQQNNGDNNLINAAISVADMAATIPAFATSSSAAINATVSDNASSFAGGQATLRNAIRGAFNNASGIVILQQNNGSNNAISAAVSVSGNGALGRLLARP